MTTIIRIMYVWRGRLPGLFSSFIFSPLLFFFLSTLIFPSFFFPFSDRLLGFHIPLNENLARIYRINILPMKHPFLSSEEDDDYPLEHNNANIWHVYPGGDAESGFI